MAEPYRNLSIIKHIKLYPVAKVGSIFSEAISVENVDFIDFLP